MPGGEALNLGPFAGGLNNVNDPADIEDNELQELVNFEVDIDGTLRSRPPLQQIVKPTASTGRLNAIGVHTQYGVKPVAAGTTGVYLWDGAAWTRISSIDLNCRCAVTYDGYLWVPANPTEVAGGSDSFKYDEITATKTYPANMPAGLACTVYKDRIWIAAGVEIDTGTKREKRRLYFSNRNPSTLSMEWGATDFIDVPGSGFITGLAVVDDTLVIFGDESTYVLGYDAAVADAVIREISPNIGASDLYCHVQHKDRTFVFHEKDVYELIDFQYVKLTNKVDFKEGSSLLGSNPVRWRYVTAIEDRIIARYQHKMYAFNMLTSTWSEFESKDTDMQSVGMLQPYEEFINSAAAQRYFVGGSAYDGVIKMYKWLPEVDGTNKETTGTGTPATLGIDCWAKTKNYSFGLWHTFKRLFWWGAEVLTHKQPNVSDFAEVESVGFVIYTDYFNASASATGVSNRRFIKLLQALRFRLINFRMFLTTDGHKYVKWFYAVPIIKAPKQTVSKKSTPYSSTS